MSTKQRRLAELARHSPQLGFTSLNHYLDIPRMPQACNHTRGDGAPGVDGRGGADFGADLGGNLRSLLSRAKSGTYRAPPVRRVHIPPGTGRETRPIGIPTSEDQVPQRAVAMALEPTYGQDSLPCSYGFRPGRPAHRALQSLRQQVMSLGGCWIVAVDIQKFFGTPDRAHPRRFLRQRVRDGVLLRLIDKWLQAGALGDEGLTHPEAGAPQGGVISPLLANVYLRYVPDAWFAEEVKPGLKGRAFPVRYADDFVTGLAREEGARRVLAVLPKRLGKYGLTTHPDKARLVPFVRPAARPAAAGPGGVPPAGSFDFLGLTHLWGRSKHGWPVGKRKTAGSRFRRALGGVAGWCRLNRHLPLEGQHRALTQELQGHYPYYGGLIGNTHSLLNFRGEVMRWWRKWLSRRKRRGQWSWARFNRLLKRFPLPPPRAWVSPCAASP